MCVSRSAEKRALHPKSRDVSKKIISDTHLEFHLLSLLGVNSYNMLVVPECVSAVLLLRGHVSLQSLQHALRLEDKEMELKVCPCPTSVLHDALSRSVSRDFGGQR